jgi:HK97 family phage prohead protease
MQREIPARDSRILRGRTLERAIIDTGERTMRFVASDESVDRYGDIIRADGWQLEHFRNNPVLLWSHDTRQPPIGKVNEIQVIDRKLIADVQFMPPGKSAFADEIWAGVEGGFVRAVSVGFAPTGPINQLVDKAGNMTGFEFTQQELFELSVVPVPANPQALAVARSLGISPATQRQIFTADEGALARAAVAARRRTIDILRLRAG